MDTSQNFIRQHYSNIVTVQELMGHKDISMTKRYSHPTPEHKKQAVKKLMIDKLDTQEIQLDAKNS